jgi:hypothetical protein
MNDKDLNSMLAAWRAPETPPGLRERALPPRRGWRVPSHIRVPTPVAALVLAAMLALGFFALRKPASPPPSTIASGLASFEPAPDLNLRVVRLPDEED